MKMTLHGAAGEVAGSAYLVGTNRACLLVECGLFQGGWNTKPKNVPPCGLEPKDLDAVLLSYAHRDHCGRRPLLLKGGYPGSIHATDAARDLAGLIL